MFGSINGGVANGSDNAGVAAGCGEAASGAFDGA